MCKSNKQKLLSTIYSGSSRILRHLTHLHLRRRRNHLETENAKAKFETALLMTKMHNAQST